MCAVSPTWPRQAIRTCVCLPHVQSELALTVPLSRPLRGDSPPRGVRYPQPPGPTLGGERDSYIRPVALLVRG